MYHYRTAVHIKEMIIFIFIYTSIHSRTVIAFPDIFYAWYEAEAAGQRYMQTMQFLHLGCLVDASADIMPEIKRRVRLAWACYKRFKRELYDMEDAPFTLKVRMLKAEVMGDPAVRVCDLDSRPGALR